MEFLGKMVVTLATLRALRVTDSPYTIYRVGCKGDQSSQGDQLSPYAIGGIYENKR